MIKCIFCNGFIAKYESGIEQSENICIYYGNNLRVIHHLCLDIIRNAEAEDFSQNPSSTQNIKGEKEQ